MGELNVKNGNEELKSLISALDEWADGRDPSETTRLVADLTALLEREGLAGFEVVEETVTPAQAARLLGVSRPHVYKLLDTGVVAHHRVGKHRRIRLDDLKIYRNDIESARKELAETFARSAGARARLRET